VTATATKPDDAKLPAAAASQNSPIPARNILGRAGNVRPSTASTSLADAPSTPKHRAASENPLKKLGDGLKKALGGSDKHDEKAAAGAASSS
jgi:hypothetical protein